MIMNTKRVCLFVYLSIVVCHLYKMFTSILPVCASIATNAFCLSSFLFVFNFYLNDFIFIVSLKTCYRMVQKVVYIMCIDVKMIILLLFFLPFFLVNVKRLHTQ